MKFVVGLLLGCSLGLGVSPGHAITLVDGGYSDSLVADFPEATTGFGGLTLDTDGSILVTSHGAKKIFRVSPTGNVEVLAVADAAVEELLDVTRISPDTILVTTRWRPQFYTLDAGGSSLVPLPDLVDTRNPMALEIAPSTFGTFGGKAIYPTFAHYGVEAIDLQTLVVTPVADVDFLADIEFSTAGRLFGVSFDANNVVEIHSDGSFSTLATLPTEGTPFGSSRPDGLAIHPSTHHIYVAEPYSQRIFEVDLDGNLSVFAEDVMFDPDFFVSGMQFSADGRKLYYLSGDTSQSLRLITGFPAVPEPTTTTLVLYAPCMCAALRINRRGH